MAKYTAKVKYTDIREIEIHADTLEEAQEKYSSGDFEEMCVDFYTENILRELEEGE